MKRTIKLRENRGEEKTILTHKPKHSLEARKGSTKRDAYERESLGVQMPTNKDHELKREKSQPRKGEEGANRGSYYPEMHLQKKATKKGGPVAGGGKPPNLRTSNSSSLNALGRVEKRLQSTLLGFQRGGGRSNRKKCTNQKGSWRRRSWQDWRVRTDQGESQGQDKGVENKRKRGG